MAKLQGLSPGSEKGVINKLGCEKGLLWKKMKNKKEKMR